MRLHPTDIDIGPPFAAVEEAELLQDGAVGRFSLLQDAVLYEGNVYIVLFRDEGALAFKPQRASCKVTAGRTVPRSRPFFLIQPAPFYLSIRLSFHLDPES